MKYANFKRMTAMVMAVAMCSPLAVNAATVAPSEEQSTANSGKLEVGSELKYLDKDKFAVVLPTVTADDLKITLDPQGLLNVADGDSFETVEGAVYFAGDSGYSNTSKALRFYNASSYDIDATVSAKVTLPKGVSLVEDKADLADAKTPSIYLALKGIVADSKTASEDGEAQALAAGDNSYSVLRAEALPEIDEGDKGSTAGYYVEVTAAQSGGAIASTYAYKLSEAAKEADNYDGKNILEYVLTGACSTDAEGWSAVLEQQKATSSVTAKIDITWKLEKHEDAPSIETTAYTLTADEDLEVEFGLGEGTKAATGVSKIVDVVAGGSVATSKYKVADGKITFDKSFVNKQITADTGSGVKFKVVFNDKNKTEVVITLSK